MVQLTLESVQNKNLFTTHFLEERVKNFSEWEEDEEIQEAFDEIKNIYERKKDRIRTYTNKEAQLEQDFIRPVLDVLGHFFAVRATIQKTSERPDYGFFESETDLDNALKDAESKDFYESSIAVGDAKAWNKDLDKKIEGKPVFENKNPSFQIDHYLRTTSPSWGVLTNGKKWRLYYEGVSHPIGTYFEVDLVDILEKRDFERFKYFYLFFRRQAFVPPEDSFLNHIYKGSETYSKELGENLETNIYQALRWMAEGYFAVGTNDLEKTEENVKMVHDNSLIFLYRLLFLLYADSKELLPSKKDIHRRYYDYSVSHWVEELLEKKDNNTLPPQGTKYYFMLSKIFRLVREGSEALDISKENFHVPAYNGGLFDNSKHLDNEGESFFDNYQIQDKYLAKVLDLLTRVQSEEEDGKARIDYSDLSLRHLGDIYEGLLEYKLKLASEDMVAEKDGGALTWTSLSKTDRYFQDYDEDKKAKEGDLYLATDKEERKATGSYYTPDYIVNYIVENTVGPVIEDKLEDAETEEEKRKAILSTNVLDPAMGSGHFLVETINFLAEKLAEFAEEEGEDREYDWAKRKVARNCIYGVDVNSLATELAKVSIWLNTMAEDKPLSFLNHHLKTGNSLIGADLHQLVKHPDGGDTTQISIYGKKFRENFKELLSLLKEISEVTEESPEDIKKQEQILRDFENHPFRKKFDALADVKTSYYFGKEFSKRQYGKLRDVILGESKKEKLWNKLSKKEWVKRATDSVPEEREDNLSDEKSFFHWKLEFPEVFFDIEEGNEKDNPGFDAVVGNPPYGADLTEKDRNFLLINFDTSKEYKNTGLQFIELCDLLTNKNGVYGQIVPKPLSYSQKWAIGRKYILPHLRLAIDVSRAFKDVLYEQIIFVADKSEKSNQYLTARGDEGGFESMVEVKKEHCENVDTLILNTKKEYLYIFQKIVGEKNLGDISRTSRGLPYQKYRTESDGVPVYGGKHISRYHLKSTDEYLQPDVIDKGKEKVQFVKQPKVMSQRIVAHVTSPTDRVIIMSALDKESKLTLDTIENTVLTDDEYSLEFINALFNSSFFSWFAYEFIFSKAIRTMDFDDYYVSKFPLPNSQPPKRLKEKIDSISDLKSEKENINVSIKDYLGNYSNGNILAEIYTPVSGLSNTILNETKSDRDNLKLGRIDFEEQNGKLILKASARYKPENEDDFDDLDRWGYTTTDLIPAMKFSGSEEELALIREFTKLAVDEAEGFARFREKATKTKTLIDRLEKLTLPKLKDVKSGLEKYLEQKERAEKIGAEIQETDNLIDAIVFDLYDLEKEEVITVLDSLDTEEETKQEVLEKFEEL